MSRERDGVSLSGSRIESFGNRSEADGEYSPSASSLSSSSNASSVALVGQKTLPVPPLHLPLAGITYSHPIPIQKPKDSAESGDVDAQRRSVISADEYEDLSEYEQQLKNKETEKAGREKIEKYITQPRAPLSARREASTSDDEGAHSLFSDLGKYEEPVIKEIKIADLKTAIRDKNFDFLTGWVNSLEVSHTAGQNLCAHGIREKALLLFTEYGAVDLVRSLLEKGVNVGAKDSYDNTALGLARRGQLENSLKPERVFFKQLEELIAQHSVPVIRGFAPAQSLLGEVSDSCSSVCLSAASRNQALPNAAPTRHK